MQICYFGVDTYLIVVVLVEFNRMMKVLLVLALVLLTDGEFEAADVS